MNKYRLFAINVALRYRIYKDFPIAAFMNIGFTHHYVIISKVNDVEQRK